MNAWRISSDWHNDCGCWLIYGSEWPNDFRLWNKNFVRRWWSKVGFSILRHFVYTWNKRLSWVILKKIKLELWDFYLLFGLFYSIFPYLFGLTFKQNLSLNLNYCWRWMSAIDAMLKIIIYKKNICQRNRMSF